jgi:type IV pilus assembly protein PilW
MKTIPRGNPKRAQAGMSLMELMIALTIGLMLLSGLAAIFASSSDANRELQKTAAQIENGRFAIETISQDLRLAGFYGHLFDLGSIATPATVPPDPCESSNAAELLKDLWFPVQAYPGTIGANPASDVRPNLSATSCGTLLTNANLKAGSDVLVIRRADTNVLAATDVATSNVYYLQAASSGAEVQVGGGVAISDKKADGVTDSTLKLSNGVTPAPAAPIRKLHVSVYFVAPCSVGTGSSGECTGAAGEDTIPTLKRLELSGVGTMSIVPLVEGIDYLKLDFGVDTSPSAISAETGYPGDATVDSYPPGGPADWTTVIAAKIYVLARNTLPTRDYVDNKTYTLGSAAVPARNDTYKRHVFSALTQLANPAGRREIP